METVHSILAVFSPRKHSQPPPPPLEDAHKPVVRAKTYSKKDRIRAKRALARISGGSDARSEHSRRSNALANAPSERRDESNFLSQPEQPEGDVDIYDVTPEKAADGPDQSTPTPKGPSQDTDPYTFEADDDEETEVGEEEEEHTFKRFTKHHWVGNATEIQVEWADGPPTWEPERNLHRDAPQALFAYWKKQGGRPPNPKDPDLFDIFAICKHSKNKRKLLVEWVGFDKQDMSWLPTSVVKATAKDVVEEYWKSQEQK
ncbi:Fc.00g032820.m01.CDS01 [Cosmosporella sp. VM-42]